MKGRRWHLTKGWVVVRECKADHDAEKGDSKLEGGRVLSVGDNTLVTDHLSKGTQALSSKQ